MNEPASVRGKSRRRFFARAAALATAAGAAALPGPRRGAGGEDHKTEAPPANRGYRLSEHVRKYYRKARF